MTEDELRDPIWRISNLYKIVDEAGKCIDFRPNPVQQSILEDIFLRGQRRIAILKARQLGCSTLIEIIALDMALFSEDKSISIVADTAENAAKLFKTKVKYGYETTKDFVKALSPLLTDTQKEMEFENGCTIMASVRQRSGTNQFLHISEWGKTAHKDPERSSEILTGAIPTVHPPGIVISESTFEGGKGGDFYEHLKQAMETPPEYKTELDFWFKFFPWYIDARYTLEGDSAQISDEITERLDEHEENLGIKFTPGQRLWYYKQDVIQGRYMLREYPTTPDEAFRVPVEGAIYSDAISEIRAKGRIVPFEREQQYPVYSCWDIGFSDYTAIWLVQVAGRELLWLWHYENSGEAAAHYVEELSKTGIVVSKHFLPHDADYSGPAAGGMTFMGQLKKAGLENMVLVPQCRDIWIGINRLRGLIKQSWIHRDNCARGIECWEAYHCKMNVNMGRLSNDPVHDWASHSADAGRTFAEAMEHGMVGPAAHQVQQQHRPGIRRAKSGIKL